MFHSLQCDPFYPKSSRSTQINPDQPISTQINPNEPRSTQIKPDQFRSNQINPYQPSDDISDSSDISDCIDRGNRSNSSISSDSSDNSDRSHDQAQPLSGSIHQLKGLVVPDYYKDCLAIFYNWTAERIAKTVQGDKIINNKVYQLVILSNYFCLEASISIHLPF